MGPILTAWDLNLKQMSGAADWSVSTVLASFSFPNLQAVFSKSLSVLFQVCTNLPWLHPFFFFLRAKQFYQFFHQGSITRRGNWWVFWNSSVLWAPWCFWARCGSRRRHLLRPRVGASRYSHDDFVVDIYIYMRHKEHPLHFLIMLIDTVDWQC